MVEVKEPTYAFASWMPMAPVDVLPPYTRTGIESFAGLHGDGRFNPTVSNRLNPAVMIPTHMLAASASLRLSGTFICKAAGALRKDP